MKAITPSVAKRVLAPLLVATFGCVSQTMASPIASGQITDPFGDAGLTCCDIVSVSAIVDSGGTTDISVLFGAGYIGNAYVQVYLDTDNNGIDAGDLFLQGGGGSPTLAYVVTPSLSVTGVAPLPIVSNVPSGVDVLVSSALFSYAGTFGVGVAVQQVLSPGSFSGVTDVAPGPGQVNTFAVLPVSEPATLALLGVGLAGLRWSRRNR